MSWGEKSLDKKLEKCCSRGSLDEKRQWERHEQTPKEKQKARQQRNRKRQIDGEKQQEKRMPKRHHKEKRGKLLNSVVPLMLICLGLWMDMERDEDSGYHASDGAPSMGPLCAPMKQR